VILSSSPKYDVLVVGAGIFGMASAYYIKMNSPDKNVIAIDRYGDVAQGNSGRSNAMYRNMFTSVDNRTLSDTSIDFYNHVQRDLGVDIGVDPIGYLWLMSEKQLSASERYIERMIKSGVEVKRYESAQLSSMIPGLATAVAGSEEAKMMKLEDVAGGFFGPKCGRLAPEKLAGFYRDEFVKLGGSVKFGADAESLIIDPVERVGLDGEPFVWQDARVDGVRLKGGNEIRADTTVVAGGAWNNELLDPAGIDGHAKSKMRQIFTVSTRTGNQPLERLLYTKGFNPSGTLPFVILPKSGLFIKPMTETSEFWVGGEDEVKRPFISYPEHDIDRYYPAEPSYYEMNTYPVLRSYLPQFEGARPSGMWSGLYSYNTLDNLPCVFTEDGLVVVGGDSGSGVMKGDALGRVADAVYRDGARAEAELFGGLRYRASKLSFKERDVEREEWIL
jgi:glycine/D-amino acid oxidase-like deaminating enzyme